MSMERFSICLCPLSFPWSVVCSSPWRDLLHPCELYSKAFYSFCSNCEWQFVLDLAFFNSVIGVEKCLWFLHIDFISWDLLKLLICFRSFSAEAMESSRYTIMSSANRDNLDSTFPIWIPFISFSCLIALARTSSTILNRSGMRGHPCLVLVFKGNASSFAHLVWY